MKLPEKVLVTYVDEDGKRHLVPIRLKYMESEYLEASKQLRVKLEGAVHEEDVLALKERPPLFLPADKRQRALAFVDNLFGVLEERG